MDAGLLVLIPAAAGCLFLAQFHRTRCSRNRWSGYHLLFQSLIYGMMLASAAVILCWLIGQAPFAQSAWFMSLKKFMQDIVSFSLNNEVHAQNYSRYLVFAVISFTLAFLLPVVYEYWSLISRRIKYKSALYLEFAQEAARRQGDFIEAELAEALVKEGVSGRRSSNDTAVELLLENGMIYAGVVLESGVTAAEKDTSVRLQLMHRGYRNKDNGKTAVLEDNTEAPQPRESEGAPIITVPVARIVSVQLFNLSADS